MSESANLEFVELSVDVSREFSTRVEDVFESAGALSVTIRSTDNEVCFDAAEPGDPQWRAHTLTALFESCSDFDCILERLEDVLEKMEFRISTLKDQDWERQCLENYVPIQIGTDLWICPSWYSPKPDSGTIVEIDPGMAFGTGSHETTRLCLEFLSRIDLEQKSVLDFGCGSGILGIAASKLGAGSVTGIDMDPRAIQTANDNAIKNDVTENFTALHNKDYFNQCDNRGQVDVVVANILANTLAELSDEISGLVNSSGLLALSGILQSQVDLVSNAYAGVFEFDSYHDQDWVLLAGFKKN